MFNHEKFSTAGPAVIDGLVGGDDWNADHVASVGSIFTVAALSANIYPTGQIDIAHSTSRVLSAAGAGDDNMTISLDLSGLPVSAADSTAFFFSLSYSGSLPTGHSILANMTGSTLSVIYFNDVGAPQAQIPPGLIFVQVFAEVVASEV